MYLCALEDERSDSGNAMDEVDKLKRHLSLLRDEYVKLQTKHSDLERKYSIQVASKGGSDLDENSFIMRLLKTVSSLFDRETYSDLTILLETTSIKAHKFILSARSDNWGVVDLNTVDQLNFVDIPQEIAMELLKWVYTDTINLTGRDEEFILGIMKCAKRFELEVLVEKCEKTLMSFVNVHNCVKFYQISDELQALNLRSHCSELITSHWDDFTSDDFVHMSAPLLYNMFKTKTNHPLHAAIRTAREDVVFLYLCEHDAQLPIKVNEIDNSGDIPLDMALKSKQESVARTLVNHKANINQIDSKGRSLLHRAVERKDEFAANFLIDNRANCDAMIATDKRTPIHLIAGQDHDEGMVRVALNLLAHGADPNYQDASGNTPLHRAIISKNEAIFDALVAQPKLALDTRNVDGLTPLALSLQILSQNEKFATTLVTKNASVDATNPMTGDTLLHLSARDLNETAGVFLAGKGAKVNAINNSGETPLHIAASNGLVTLVETLLNNGANCNLLTSPANYSDSVHGNDVVFNQTALHLAILSKHEDVINKIVKHKPSGGVAFINAPNLNLKNSKQQTPLSLAIKKGLHNVAQLLIDEGASVNVTNSDGLTLLHEAIIDGDSRSAMFLLNCGADTNISTPDGETPLQLAVTHKLEPVVMDLCAKGADVNAKDGDGNPLLWRALETGNEDVASVLVQFNADTNCWGPGMMNDFCRT